MRRLRLSRAKAATSADGVGVSIVYPLNKRRSARRLDAHNILPDFVEPEMSAPRSVLGEQEVEEPDAGLRFDPAPRAIAQLAVVVMAVVRLAFFERLRQRVQRLHPLAPPVR